MVTVIKQAKARSRARALLVTPEDIRQALATIQKQSISSPWLCAFEKRVRSIQVFSGQWILYYDENVLCTAQVTLNARDDPSHDDESLWRLQIFAIPLCKSKSYIDTPDEELLPPVGMAVSMVTSKAAHVIQTLLPEDVTTAKVRVSALERSTIPYATQSLQKSPLNLIESKRTGCGLFVCHVDPERLERLVAKFSNISGASFRRINQSDAELINSRWEEHKSSRSINIVREVIESSKYGCIGAELDGKLRAWILRYTDGPLGLFWCDEEFRRCGLGKHVLWRSMMDYNKHGETTVICYIVDGNTQSIKCLQRLGFKHVASAEWLIFENSRNKKKMLSKL